MTKEELQVLVDFANQSTSISESAKDNLKEILENANDYIHLINTRDIRYIDYPEYWTRETVDEWLDKPLTDDEFNELSYRLRHLDSYDSDTILFTINEIRDN